jgi:mycofactocin precursor peptide peptidase
MTWPDVSAAVASGVTTIILPLGANEQHGPHLPLGTDTLLAAALAAGLANDTPNTLVAPALPFGCSDEHTGFPGLLSLDTETLARVIVDCARRLAAWGITRLIVLSAHGGNGHALALASERLSHELPSLQVDLLGTQTTMPNNLLTIAQADGLSPEMVGIHAGEGETSEMLFLHPGLVHMERAAPGYTGDMVEIMPRLMQAGLQGVTQNGVLGDPCAAQASRGKRYLTTQLTSYKKQLSNDQQSARQLADQQRSS